VAALLIQDMDGKVSLYTNSGRRVGNCVGRCYWLHRWRLLSFLGRVAFVSLELIGGTSSSDTVFHGIQAEKMRVLQSYHSDYYNSKISYQT